MANNYNLDDVFNKWYVQAFLLEEDIPTSTIIVKYDGDNYDSGVESIRAHRCNEFFGQVISFKKYTVEILNDKRNSRAVEDKSLSKKWRAYIYKKLEAIDPDLAEQYKDGYTVRGLLSMDKIKKQISDLESQLDEIKNTHF